MNADPVPSAAPPAARRVAVTPAAARARARRRLAIALWSLGVGALAIYVLNAIVPSWSFPLDEWIFRPFLPTMRPLGNDFRVGIYLPAELVRAGRSPYEILNVYPPLVAVLGLPATVLDPQAAYVVHVVLLVAANAAAIALAVSLTARVVSSASPRHAWAAARVAPALTLVVAFLAFTSYGFLFSVERGNIDVFPLLLSLAMLWLVANRRRALWLQVVLLALAVHLKIYPLVLFPLLLWVHGVRCLLPFAAVNAAFLSVLGRGRIREFVEGISVAVNNPATWTGNHSAAVFTRTVLEPSRLAFPGAATLLALVPLALVAAGALVLWRRGRTPVNLLLAFALAVPAMNLVPATSHDYKLVLLWAPTAILLLGAVLDWVVAGTARPAVTIAILLVLTALLSHGYTIVAPYVVAEPAWLANRYVWILLLQLLVLVEVLAPAGVFRSHATNPAAPAPANA